MFIFERVFIYMSSLRQAQDKLYLRLIFRKLSS